MHGDGRCHTARFTQIPSSLSSGDAAREAQQNATKQLGIERLCSRSPGLMQYLGWWLVSLVLQIDGSIAFYWVDVIACFHGLVAGDPSLASVGTRSAATVRAARRYSKQEVPKLVTLGNNFSVPRGSLA